MVKKTELLSIWKLFIFGYLKSFMQLNRFLFRQAEISLSIFTDWGQSTAIDKKNIHQKDKTKIPQCFHQSTYLTDQFAYPCVLNVWNGKPQLNLSICTRFDALDLNFYFLFSSFQS